MYIHFRYDHRHTCAADEVLASLIIESEIFIASRLWIITCISGLSFGSKLMQFLHISAHTFTCSSIVWLSDISDVFAQLSSTYI